MSAELVDGQPEFPDLSVTVLIGFTAERPGAASSTRRGRAPAATGQTPGTGGRFQFTRVASHARVFPAGRDDVASCVRRAGGPSVPTAGTQC